MKLTIQYQDHYSRGELLLRTFFGALYIGLPHGFILIFLGLWGAILGFIGWWSILFTGRYPQSFFEYQVKLIRWRIRVNARILNLVDGYPAFGLSAEDDMTDFQLPYPESLSKGKLLLKTFFGFFYIVLPHFIVLYLLAFPFLILMQLSWWAVLFKGGYPKLWHEFAVQYIRWGIRLNLYYPMFMTDDYPPFHGREDDDSPEPTIADVPPPAPVPPLSPPALDPTPAQDEVDSKASSDSGDGSGEEKSI